MWIILQDILLGYFIPYRKEKCDCIYRILQSDTQSKYQIIRGKKLINHGGKISQMEIITNIAMQIAILHKRYTQYEHNKR